MVPVKPVKADLLTELKQTIYVPIATKQTYGSVKIGDGFTVDNGVINFDKSEVTILSISLNGELLNIDDNKNVNIALTKNDVGLDQVDNTSDKDKPISNAQQEALNRKLDKKQSLSEVGKFLYVSDDGDIDFKNVDTIKVKLNNETIDAGAGIFNFSNNFVVTSVAGGQVDIDLSEEFKESVGKIDSISLNGVPQTIDVNKNVNLVIPIDDKLDKSNADRDVITNQTISINGDNVSLVNSYINLNSLVTKTQSNKFSLANDNQAGLMSVSDYKSIRDLQARVGQLEQKATRLLYDEKLYPTADEINTFVTSMGYMVPFEGIAVVVSGTNHIWHYYEGGTGWKDDGVDVVSQFTNDIAGIIKGSASDGKVYAETDGTGSVYGWDSLKNNVTNLSNQFVNYTPTSNLSAVALSGNYSDLLNKPTFSTVATSGSYNDLLNLPDLSAYVLKSNTDGYATGFIKNFEDSSGIELVVDGMSTYSNGVSLTLRSGGSPSISFGSYSSTYSVGFNLDNAKNVFSGPLYNLRDSEWEGESIPTVADDDMVVVKGDLADYYTEEETQTLIETFFEENYQFFNKLIDNKVDKIVKTNVKPILNEELSTWRTMTWNGYNSIQGNLVWTDGFDIYYSSGMNQYVLDKANHTWNTKTWNINITGGNIWTDGNNIYSSLETNNQYVLDKDSGDWIVKTWNGYTNIIAKYIWTDGIDIYYSYWANQYILNKGTSTWETKVWNGLSNFYGEDIWTDGIDIYYSSGTSQKVLNKTTSTWDDKTWNGLTNFFGNSIWTDGKNIYCGVGISQYILNKGTSTWETKVWNGATIEVPSLVWTDGIDIYYSTFTSQYVLDKPFQTPFGIDTIKNLQGQINKKMSNILNETGKISNDYLQDTVLLSTDSLVLDGGTSTITTV